MMRKGILFIAFSMVIGGNYVSGQSFKSGTISLQSGVELGGNYGLSQYTSQSLAKAVSVDYGLPIKLDDGCLGFGIYYGAKSLVSINNIQWWECIILIETGISMCLGQGFLIIMI